MYLVNVTFVTIFDNFFFLYSQGKRAYRRVPKTPLQHTTATPSPSGIGNANNSVSGAIGSSTAVSRTPSFNPSHVHRFVV